MIAIKLKSSSLSFSKTINNNEITVMVYKDTFLRVSIKRQSGSTTKGPSLIRPRRTNSAASKEISDVLLNGDSEVNSR